MRSRFLFLAPLATGLLLLASFPPARLFFPQFLALLPLFYLLEHERSERKALLASLLAGLTFFGGLLYWITLFTQPGYVVLILAMSLNFPLFAFTVRRLRSRLGVPVAWSAPLVWTAIEYLHAHTELAFTWGQLGYTLTHYPLWLQSAAFTGPYGITLWVVGVNSVLYVLIGRLRRGDGRLVPAAGLALLLVLPLAVGLLSYGRYDRSGEGTGTLRVSYVQPSIPQELKWSPELRDSTFALLMHLSRARAGESPDLVVWPEAAAPAYLRIDPHYRRLLGSLAQELQASLLTGGLEYRQAPTDSATFYSYNSAFLFDRRGELTGQYDKTHLVPISERMPYEQVFTFLQEIDVGGSHFVPGTEYKLFELDGGRERFGLLICFESIFPELSRRFVREGATFLVNITNDAWFERTTAVHQHSAFLVLRAIEQGREVVRSANTGISAFYDRLGRRREASALYETVSRTGTIRTYSDRTFYNRYGDWPAHLAWGGSLLLLALSCFPSCRPRPEEPPRPGSEPRRQSVRATLPR